MISKVTIHYFSGFARCTLWASRVIWPAVEPLLVLRLRLSLRTRLGKAPRMLLVGKTPKWVMYATRILDVAGLRGRRVMSSGDRVLSEQVTCVVH